MEKFDPAQIRNPSTDRHKIWNRWLCPRDDPLCKISCKSVHCGLLGKWVKYYENFSGIYIYTFFCWSTYRSDRPVDFHARWLGQRGPTQGSNLFGNQNSKLIFNPCKIPPKSKIWPKTDRNFRPKTLLYKNFSTLTVRRRDGEWYHLFWFLLFSMCHSSHIAVNKCINWCFVHLF